MKIGILTDPPRTYIIPTGTIYRPKFTQMGYDKLPEEYKKKPQSFLRFLGGNFSEVLTFFDDITNKGHKVEVVLLLGNKCIHQDSEITPHEVTQMNPLREGVDIHHWLNSLDIVIISVSNRNMQSIEEIWPKESITTVIVVGGKTQKQKLSNIICNLRLFLFRKGVARFGVKNRDMITKYLQGKGIK